ncbi:hypothetical protein E6O75_ATG10204 [Venturia nashicola]|uniref:Uncharacterized protein n=1 Tax=Venturia nashicola TaxID=86259 RepID=A0A4Z1NGI1_9PEZI|nr:hypothetical protein E6O75_ATG10204 [Venturia nashicola]
MAFTIHPDRKEAVRLMSRPDQASSRTSSRSALGDITNTSRLNKSKAENISTGFIFGKRHEHSNDISIPVRELPKFLSKPPEITPSFFAEDYSQSDPELDDAASEGSQLTIDSIIDPQTFEKTLVNSPCLERPTNNGVKEIKDAVLERETQPIDEVSQDLKLDHHLQRRTGSKRANIPVGDDEQDAQLGFEHIKHHSPFAQALAKISSICPSTHQENNNIIENWLHTSSPLWNADIRLSTSGIALIGDEVTLEELKTASQFAELNLPSLPQLISAIESVGKSPSNETKEIVVGVLRSPEVASKLKEYNLSFTLERFNAVINCNQEEWKESEVLRDYDLARDEVESQPNSIHNKASFANETTIIGYSSSHTEYISTSLRSVEIIKEAKGIGRAYSWQQ